MRKLQIGIIDILGKSPGNLFARYSRPNNQSIMPQVVAVWCEELGHDAHIAYQSGPDIMAGDLPDALDVVFINAFSENALLGYALSNYYRSKGAVTILGGPHARSYPDHSLRYFDYAVGFCDKNLLRDLLQEAEPHRPVGHFLSARQQPVYLPGLRQRWKFMAPILEKAPLFKAIPILGSLGCPYTCSFCIDAQVPYQPLDFDVLKDDLRFILEQKAPRTFVAWHDPNFGIKFDEYLGVIEETVPAGSLTFLAEMSLALLKEENVKRLARNGFKVILPGVESWYDMGNKSKMRVAEGMEKVERVAEQANMIVSYIPYMQANLILGLDADQGPEPFECTKRFVDLAPGVYPYFSLLMAYGGNAPDNLRYQREGRILNIPFHFLNQIDAMNVRPRHYSWPEFYDHVCDVYAYAYSPRAMFRRFMAKKDPATRFEQLLRTIAFERGRKYKMHRQMRERLKDPAVRRYFEGETTALPAFYIDPIREDLGPMWHWLPKDAIAYDPNAHLATQEGAPVTARAGMAMA
ncbi:MAG: radical SAM protein [Rhodothermales bacterium]